MMRKTLTTTRALIPLVFSLVLTLVFTIRAEPAAAELRLLAADRRRPVRIPNRRWAHLRERRCPKSRRSQRRRSCLG